MTTEAQHVVLGEGEELEAVGIPGENLFAVNLKSGPIGEQLRRSGFRSYVPAFFSWLGGPAGLTLETTLATLRFIASLPHGTAVLLDYAPWRRQTNSAESTAMDAFACKIENADGDVLWRIDPRSLKALLKAVGFGEIQEVEPAGPDPFGIHQMQAQV